MEILNEALPPLYDIYLGAGCRASPEISDLAERIPALADANVVARFQAVLRPHPRFPGLNRSEEPPGFLGLDLPQDLARALYQRLAAARARGEVLPSAYRQPRVSQEEARPIAEQAIQHLQAASFSGYAFEPVCFHQEAPRWWSFVAGSEQLQEEGYIPGALFACVDKLDGHVWEDDEMLDLEESR